MMSGILYFFGLIVGYILLAQISKYLSARLFHSERDAERYKTHIFVCMNMIYTIMIVIFNWFFEINSTPMVLFIAAGVIIYLYADYLKEETQQ